MRLELIAAVARNGVIGAGGAMPWHLSEDLRRFRALTTGHTVIMGRRTWESLPRALPGRQNVVVSRQREYPAPGATVVGSFAEALAQAALPEPVFCIGGGELFRIALPLSDVVHLTAIDRDFPGDATFPALDPAHWRETEREAHRKPGPDGFEYAFITCERAR